MGFTVLLQGCQSFNSWPPQALLAPASAPTLAKAEAIGFYSGGCLQGGMSLEGDENGLEFAHVGRGRFWAHPYMIDLLTELGEFTHKNFKKKVIVGDLSLSRGGPTVGGHSSHQNGLDADLWYKLAPTRSRSFQRREVEVMPSVLTEKGFNKYFSKPQRILLSFLAQDNRVARVFVHPKIKKALCEGPRRLFTDKSLAKIRPWFGHDDHLHLRLKCPQSDKNCVAQEPPKEGSGCDELKWWESEEAVAAEKAQDHSFSAARSRYIKVTNALPPVCQEIYTAAKATYSQSF